MATSVSASASASASTSTWNGPFNGFLFKTPVNTETGKSQQIFTKTLEEAKEKALEFPGKVGGITKIRKDKYSLRLGDRVFPSPKGEVSWILTTQSSGNSAQSLLEITPLPKSLPENEEKWTKEDYAAYEEWEENENARWIEDKKEEKRATTVDDFLPWTYEGQVFLLNSKTNQVKDLKTKNVIGKRMVFKATRKDGNSNGFEVLIWSKNPEKYLK